MTEWETEPSQRWNSAAYQDDHSYVFEYGEDVVSLLKPEDGERILDLGCGTGHLTALIAESGATVVGLDASEAMVAQAREIHSDCEFVHADAQSYSFDEPFDAVFSNAALHWITDQDAVLQRITESLIPGGRFVAELGGAGNIDAIVSAVREVADDEGFVVDMPWYFPTIAEYATALEFHGLETRFATLFDRPTPLENGSDGLAEWFNMFGDGLFDSIPEAERSQIVTAVEDQLRDDQYRNGSWIADYRRLRVVAIK